MSASLRSRPQSAAGTPSSPRSHPRTTAEAPSSPRSRPWTSAGSRGRKKGLSKIPSVDNCGTLTPRSAATGWTSARDAPEPHDPLAGASGEQLRAAVRCAVRLELVAFFGEQAARKGGPQRPSVAPDFVQSQTVWDELTDDGSGDASKSLHAQHFTKFTQADHKVHGLSHGSTYSDLGQSQPICQPNLSSQGATLTAAASFAKRLWLKDEPERSGPLAALVRSRFFERTIQAVILTNCLVMGLSANYEMNHAPTFSDEDFGHNIFTTLDIIFQVFYTLELILKLAVHREFFFWNQDAGLNTFDLFLVISGYVDLLFANGGGGSTALRAVRVLKLGKALRALKVVKGFRILRAILVCIQASFVTLLWSVIMLCLVFYVFSLIFVQQAASRLEDIGDRDDPVSIVILDNFKSVQTSMVTLAKAAFGGEDWGVALDVVAECGFMSALFYMLFIAFSQIALINIITGIFVESAMQSLAPNREQLATQLDVEEKGYAKELEMLCISVDADKSGCLTKEQFNNGIKEGRIPLLLHLLGLSRTNVENFFQVLCDASPDNQVDIKSFVRGCMRLKGAATSFDLQTMMLDLKKIEGRISREFRCMSNRIVAVERCMRPSQTDDVLDPT